jgi:uncharacterized protein (TIGR02646 family)
MLRYPKGPQPGVLTRWQATPNAGWESLPAADKDEVRAAVVRDQGHLCAYCQRRIPTRDGRMKIEHWLAQSEGKDVLRWTNLLGVCLGDESAETGSPRGERHCDTARGNARLFLHPVEGHGPSPRDHLVYSAEGEVRPRETPQSDVVQRDIDALNLNAPRLRRARVAAYDALKQRLEKAGWTAKALRGEHRAAQLQPGIPAPPQCGLVSYLVEGWARKRGVSISP